MKFEYPVAIRFRCIKCGMCCGDTKEKTRHILLLKSEAEQVSKATSQPILKFAVKTLGNEPYEFEMKKKMEDGKCLFLKNDHCTIYSVRPLICRFYPFELNSHGGNYHFLFTKECLGIGKGKLLGEGYFKKLFRLALDRLKGAVENRH